MPSVGGCQCGIHSPGSLYIKIRFALLANRGNLILSIDEIEELRSMALESLRVDDDTVDFSPSPDNPLDTSRT